ncbi:uncharacterized protein LOC131150175 [Malania oleifera]|uniref:uncharacterized protein LOC131150175 n=1 Tax=Malania oleifera TaxID=397392 RepID=UPI0025ADB89C|nr:uncharacterized protein LOC131150175 [Malania oleifera]
MDFFRSVFSDDPEPADSLNAQTSPPNSPPLTPTAQSNPSPNPNPNPNPNISMSDGAWSFGGLIKTLTSRSETVIETYRRDIEEFRSGLKKETAVIREVASRAVKDLPGSLEIGASVAQESLESVGQAIDDFGSSVWRGTAEIISQGRDTLLAADHDSDYSSDNNSQHYSLSSKRYSRFDAQVRAIQCDKNTYCEEPEDLSDYDKWKVGFELDEKVVEIENLFVENGAMEGIYKKLVPSIIDQESFWSRYFYRVHKLKQAEDARANLVKRAISGEEEELTWDVDDEEDDAESTSNVTETKNDITGNKELEKIGLSKFSEERKSVESREKNSTSESGDDGTVAEFGSADPSDAFETNSNKSVAKADEKLVVEGGKADNAGSCKDSDVSVVSSQPSVPEEEDLGWDEIEDIGNNDESKVVAGGSPNRADLRKRLSTAEEDEDLTWDIEDNDDPN